MDDSKVKETPTVGKTQVDEPSKKCKKKEEIEKLSLKNAELNDKVLRLTAEMQNMSRRFDQERSNFYKYDGENLIKKLLPIIDNFERAINMDDANLNDDVSKFLSGFKMIYTSLLNELKSLGVTEIEALGKQFDPNTMEAIMTANIPDEEQNVVIDVMQKGYMYNGKKNTGIRLDRDTKVSQILS